MPAMAADWTHRIQTGLGAGHKPRRGCQTSVALGQGRGRGWGRWGRKTEGAGPEAKGAPTLGSSGTHHGDFPAPRAIPAPHGEAEAVGRGGLQAGQQEGIPRGVGLEDEVGVPSCCQLLRHHRTRVHVPLGHHPGQSHAGDLGLAPHVLHWVGLCGFKCSTSRGSQHSPRGGQNQRRRGTRHFCPWKGAAATGRNKVSSGPDAHLESEGHPEGGWARHTPRRAGLGQDGQRSGCSVPPERHRRTHGLQHQVRGGLERPRLAQHGQGEVESRCVRHTPCPRRPLAQARLTTALPACMDTSSLMGTSEAVGRRAGRL